MIKAWTEYNLTTGEELTLITIIVVSKSGYCPEVVIETRMELAQIMGVTIGTFRKNLNSLMEKGLVQVGSRKCLEVTETVNQRLA